MNFIDLKLSGATAQAEYGSYNCVITYNVHICTLIGFGTIHSCVMRLFDTQQAVISMHLCLQVAVATA